MSEPINDSTVKGKWNETAGSVKQSIGEATGNQELANEGLGDQIKGHAQEAWGAVKGAFHHETTAPDSATHQDENSTRDSIASAAERAKNAVVESMEKLKHRND